MAGLELVKSDKEKEMPSGREQGSFVDPKSVIGRDKDKIAILEKLLMESDNGNLDVPIVIAIVGIGGMGKTTLAQLVYNDYEVKKNFEKRWFACISDTSDEKEVLGKIFQSICEKNYSGFTVSQLQTKIRESIEGKNFLLVLDDVWEEDYSRWQHRMSLLSRGAKRSKIIVTTRSSSVATAVDAIETHNLYGLSEDDSWDLFKRVAFTPENENDPRLIDLGREIVKKCANVPLAIKSIGSLLRIKDTIQEWESFKDKELSKLKEQGGDSIMIALKLSYQNLPSDLKPCFAYCSLFPKDYEFDVLRLIYLWIAQGYIKPNDEEMVEDIGRSYFLDLLRRSFFQEAEEGLLLGVIERCKMHDLLHDLAQYVAGEEVIIVARSPNQIYTGARHACVGWEMNNSWESLAPVVNRLRSFVFSIENSNIQKDLSQQLTNLKCLRVLNLSRAGMVNVSSSIGELKHLRFLDLSGNKFEILPDSMTNLLNLIALDMRDCKKLKSLPSNFRKLINLRYMNISWCNSLKHMPPGMEELTCLQYLSEFKVGKATSGVEGVKRSGLDALAGLVELRGELRMVFEDGIDDWGDADECWQLPVSTQRLVIYHYPGRRTPQWADGMKNNLANLDLRSCPKVKYLPPLRVLPNLRSLFVGLLPELEYVEEDDDKHSGIAVAAAAGSINNASSLFFPRLEVLTLLGLPKLKGWCRRKVADPQEQHSSSTCASLFLSFPLLSQLCIDRCPELRSIPLCPRLRDLDVFNLNCNDVIQTIQSSSSLEKIEINVCEGLSSLHLAPPHLQTISIESCHELMSIEVVEAPTTSLRALRIEGCKQLKNLQFAHPNVVEELMVRGCPELELWESNDKRRCQLDWDSLPNLSKLTVNRLPPPEKLPQCLVHRQALGKLQIIQDPGIYDERK